MANNFKSKIKLRLSTCRAQQQVLTSCQRAQQQFLISCQTSLTSSKSNSVTKTKAESVPSSFSFAQRFVPPSLSLSFSQLRGFSQHRERSYYHYSSLVVFLVSSSMGASSNVLLLIFLHSAFTLATKAPVVSTDNAVTGHIDFLCKEMEANDS